MNIPLKQTKNDDGTYTVTADYYPESSWTADTAQNATRQAHHGLEELTKNRVVAKPGWMQHPPAWMKASDEADDN